MLSTISLVNAVFYGHHGVLQEEHRIGGRYEVDVSMDLDVEQAAESDDLALTADYERVYTIVRESVMGKKRYLIEAIAREIAVAVLEAAPRVEAVRVTVRKPNPPVGGPCDRAEVVYRAGRAE